MLHKIKRFILLPVWRRMDLTTQYKTLIFLHALSDWYQYKILRQLLEKPKARNLLQIKKQYCDGKITCYGKQSEYVEIRDFYIDFSKKLAKDNDPPGYYNMLPGAFQIDCLIPDNLYGHGILWKFFTEDTNRPAEITFDSPAVIIPKYNWMCGIAHTVHWFTALYEFLDNIGYKPATVTVFEPGWIDTASTRRLKMNSVLKEMFGSVYKLENDNAKVFFKRAFIINSNYIRYQKINATTKFKDWALTSCKTNGKLYTRELKKIVYIKRASPGATSRFVRNEAEILAVIRNEFPQTEVVESQLELLRRRKQVKLLANTDIVFSTHGSGLVFASYLVPQNGGILELFPPEWNLPHATREVRTNCALRQVHYRRIRERNMENTKFENKSEQSGYLGTEYNPKDIVRKIADIYKYMQRYDLTKAD